MFLSLLHLLNSVNSLNLPLGGHPLYKDFLRQTRLMTVVFWSRLIRENVIGTLEKSRPVGYFNLPVQRGVCKRVCPVGSFLLQKINKQNILFF